MSSREVFFFRDEAKRNSNNTKKKKNTSERNAYASVKHVRRHVFEKSAAGEEKLKKNANWVFIVGDEKKKERPVYGLRHINQIRMDRKKEKKTAKEDENSTRPRCSTKTRVCVTQTNSAADNVPYYNTYVCTFSRKCPPFAYLYPQTSMDFV